MGDSIIVIGSWLFLSAWGENSVLTPPSQDDDTTSCCTICLMRTNVDEIPTPNEIENVCWHTMINSWWFDSIFQGTAATSRPSAIATTTSAWQLLRRIMVWPVVNKRRPQTLPCRRQRRCTGGSREHRYGSRCKGAVLVLRAHLVSFPNISCFQLCKRWNESLERGWVDLEGEWMA